MGVVADILPALFTSVSIPASVERELRHTDALELVQDLMRQHSVV